MTLKEIRNVYHLTQKEAAEIIGTSLRTLKSYESDEENADQFQKKMGIENDCIAGPETWQLLLSI